METIAMKNLNITMKRAKKKCNECAPLQRLQRQSWFHSESVRVHKHLNDTIPGKIPPKKHSTSKKTILGDFSVRELVLCVNYFPFYNMAIFILSVETFFGKSWESFFCRHSCVGALSAICNRLVQMLPIAKLLYLFVLLYLYFCTWEYLLQLISCIGTNADPCPD